MPVMTVLWALALLTAVSTSLLWSGTMSYSLAHYDLELAGSTARANGAVKGGVDAMPGRGPDRRWRADGRPQRAAFEGTPIMISIQDELGKIDLNQADVPLLLGLLRSAG